MTQIPPEVHKALLLKVREAFHKSAIRESFLKQKEDENGLYQCQSCEGRYCYDNIRIDHIDPVIDPEDGFTTYDEYINRLYDASNIQLLCLKCHQSKTNDENRTRRQTYLAAPKPVPESSPAPKRQVSMELMKEVKKLADEQGRHPVDLLEEYIRDGLRKL